MHDRPRGLTSRIELGQAAVRSEQERLASSQQILNPKPCASFYFSMKRELVKIGG